MPLPWRIALRTKTAMAIYALTGTTISVLANARFDVDVSVAAAVQGVLVVVTLVASAAALIGRRLAPVRDVPRLQKVAAREAARRSGAFPAEPQK